MLLGNISESSSKDYGLDQIMDASSGEHFIEDTEVDLCQTVVLLIYRTFGPCMAWHGILIVFQGLSCLGGGDLLHLLLL